MPESGTILNYHGPVDPENIDKILKILKQNRGFRNLSLPVSKRLYGIVVECLENISNYSVTLDSPDIEQEPYIIVSAEKANIKVIAGNPVSSASTGNIMRKLDELNRLDQAQLKTCFVNKLDDNYQITGNGAGLGLIYMAFITGRRLNYNFKQLNDRYSLFNLEISLMKYSMRKLILDQTDSTPKVILDPENKVFLFAGESRPPDVREFYNQIIGWLNEYSLYLREPVNKNQAIEFNFDFDYFNSSSAKMILDICKILAVLCQINNSIKINWRYEKDDVDMLEVGREMSKISKCRFEFVETVKD
jgi:hypothetical protein